ncbi:hypothetical protein TIFTF001_005285 [Ficus carica]|uniref:Uncharacterized protein n=1 Tax=Ficus carica TaxID=3494 RepID=A0AA87ZXT3_FICCA|nr:hypothetical protein TIFTF001_005285 [Ficus carica]
MIESAYVKGNGNHIITGGLVEEPWVRLTDADCEIILPQEVSCCQELIRRTQPPLCLLACDVSHA